MASHVDKLLHPFGVSINIYANDYFLCFLLPLLMYANEYCRSMAEQKSKKGNTRAYLSWTAEMDIALLDTLVEHQNNGDHAQNGWKPHVYTACINNVNDTCDVAVNKDKIVGRVKTFDKHYEIISKMLAQSGFVWDSEKKMVEVESDEVWSRYVEVIDSNFR